MRLTRILLATAIALLALCLQYAGAQSARPQFEVASVKAGRAGQPFSVGPVAGRFSATSTPLRVLIQRAYAPPNGRSLLRSQIIGGPAWIDSDIFDIDAKAEGDSRPTPDQMWQMVQPLLEDRFQLKVHHEMRDLPLYYLVVAKSGKLKLSPDQTPVDPAAPRIYDPAASGPPRGAFRMIGKPSPTAITLVMTGNAVRMDALMNMLQQYLDRPLIDRTARSRLYDVELQFDITSGPPVGGAGNAPAAQEPGIGSIFTAVQEQLGLKLESAKGPVDVLVIDGVSKPTEN
ncbi:MAG TPA: TIGR03435 family protein [Terriglobia bacterium]|jgi:uncharacterized protein (TIGR03435 family)